MEEKRENKKRKKKNRTIMKRNRGPFPNTVDLNVLEQTQVNCGNYGNKDLPKNKAYTYSWHMK
jgi:hypothetical protein